MNEKECKKPINFWEPEEMLKDLPFPEHLADKLGPEASELLRRNWSGDPEILSENIEKALGIKIIIEDLKTGTMRIEKREPEREEK